MSFSHIDTSGAKIDFDAIVEMQTQCDRVMRGRIDVSIDGKYFFKSLNTAEKLAVRNVVLGFIYRRLNGHIGALRSIGVETLDMFDWLPATSEEFIAQLEVEYAPPAEEPAP